MQVIRACQHNVATIGREETLLEAARRMRNEHVGDLVVVDTSEGRCVPVGVLTDRDIVVGVVAKDGTSDLEKLDVGDVLTSEVVTAREDEDVDDVLLRMKRYAVRRIPVVDAAGILVGIFTLDDVLTVLYREMSGVHTLVTQQLERERGRRP